MTGSKMAYSANAMSFNMRGKFINPVVTNAQFYQWWISSSYRIQHYMVSSGTVPRFLTSEAGTTQTTTGALAFSSTGKNEFNIASRMTPTEQNLAEGGTAATATARTVSIPDLSSTTFYLNENPAATSSEPIPTMTIALFQQDDNDWTDTGITYESST